MEIERVGHALATQESAISTLEKLRKLATEVLRRIAGSDPFAITAATLLAELTLKATTAAALDEAARETKAGETGS